MKKSKREYRQRRLYFEQYAPNPMAHWQRDDYTSPDIKWIYADVFYKSVENPLHDLETFGQHIKENIPGARLVYDMLLMLYGIEFDSDDKLAWFMLKYT
jgi:hypothetical protein